MLSISCFMYIPPFSWVKLGRTCLCHFWLHLPEELDLPGLIWRGDLSCSFGFWLWFGGAPRVSTQFGGYGRGRGECCKDTTGNGSFQYNTSKSYILVLVNTATNLHSPEVFKLTHFSQHPVYSPIWMVFHSWWLWKSKEDGQVSSGTPLHVTQLLSQGNHLSLLISGWTNSFSLWKD